MASTYTATVEKLRAGISSNYRDDIVVTYAITAAANGSVTDIGTDDDSSNGVTVSQYILGKRLNAVEAFPTVGGVAPDAADITVKQNGLDILGGNGINLIHATDTKSTYPMIDGFPALYPIRSELTIGVANQVTNAAQFTIKMTFAL